MKGTMKHLIEVRSLLDHKYGATQVIEQKDFDKEIHILPEDFKEKKTKAAKKPAVIKEDLISE